MQGKKYNKIAFFDPFKMKQGTRNRDKLYYKTSLFDGAGGPLIIPFRNEAMGRIKFVIGPHLAPGPHFGDP